MCTYIDTEYLIANAFLKKLKEGTNILTLSEVSRYKKNVENRLSHCVIKGSYDAIYNVTEIYSKFYKIYNDKIELVDDAGKSENKLKIYFREGLPKEISEAFEYATF